MVPFGDYLCRPSRMQFTPQEWWIYLEECDLREPDSPNINEADFEEVLNMFECFSFCLWLLMLYNHRKLGTIYAGLFGEMHFIVPINKGTWVPIFIQLCDYSLELRYSEKNTFYQNHYQPNSSVILWYQGVGQRYSHLHI